MPVDINPSELFNAPIPGESLTRTPGGSPWERPSQFADKDEAAEYLFTELTRPEKARKLVAMVEVGAPVEMLAKGVLFKGFMDGKWTPDTALLLTKVTMGIILGIAKKGGVKESEITYRNPGAVKDEMDFFKRIDEKSGGKIREKYQSSQVKPEITEVISESESSGKPMSLMEKL